MADLQLDSLEIQGFRGFRHLQISRLGLVNLVVGKNNVGKTSLLEAVRLYAQRGSPNLIWELLDVRDESPFGRAPSTNRLVTRIDKEEQALEAIRYLFFGRKDIIDTGKSIQVGSIKSLTKVLSKAITIEVGLLQERFPRSSQLIPTSTETDGDDALDVHTFILAISIGGLRSAIVPLEPEAAARNWRRNAIGERFKEIPNVFISANGLDKNEVGSLWDAINLTSLQEDVLDALKIIAPIVTGVGLMVEERIPIVRVVGLDAPVPLKSMGEGMNRLFGIALALANAKDGFLLIDEIENGIHYSVQPDAWQLIFRVARQLNVQVFATSHSWDCIEAFQKVANDEKQEEGMLIRLEERDGDIDATLFTEEELMIATRSQIEVR
ncbi:MAG TPA: ATP-binding protein [Chloroflexia bacterium]|jgi:hypothetical protein